jgi:hypothetical protein
MPVIQSTPITAKELTAMLNGMIAASHLLVGGSHLLVELM